MQTIREIEEAMANVLLHPSYKATCDEYHRLLSIMGNVDGDEVISLVIVAALSVGTILEPRKANDWWQP